MVLATIGCAAAIVAVVLFALSFTSFLAVRSVQATGTSHLSGQDIRNLASVQEGTSLLGLDVEGVRSRVSQNPWVANVEVDRGFDGTVTIRVTERVPVAIVVMNSSEVCWYLSEDGVWLEPADAKPTGGRTIFEVALDEARTKGILLIGDVVGTVSPQAGAKCTDAPILAALDYQNGFDDELKGLVAYYDAPSESSISCVLESGIEVSLGAPKDIAAKNTVILALLEQYPNQLTYINVRVPARPTYRMLDGVLTTEGTGLYDPSTDGPIDTQATEGTDTGEEETDEGSGEGYDDESEYSGYDSGYYGDDSGSYDSTYDEGYGY